MPRRQEILLNNHIYHIYNRGVQKNNIFLASNDYQRFLETLFYYLRHDYPYSLFLRLKRKAQQNQRELEFLGHFRTIHRRKAPVVDLIAYCLMPNHYHLILEQKIDEGTREFMQKLGSSYSHYFNIRHEKNGSLFQGRFKNVWVASEKQLLYLSKYVHTNPISASLVQPDTLGDYQWSSLNDYLTKGVSEFVVKDKILAQFQNEKDGYRKHLYESIKSEFVEQIEGSTIDDDFGWY